MADASTFTADLLEAIDEPALIVRAGRTLFANTAALRLLGPDIPARDVRLAIRHPLALAAIDAHEEAEIDLVGIGSVDRPWHLTARRLADGSTLVRLADRSRLVGAERMRTDFVANASHELRTPLATIIGFAETLAEAAPLDEALRSRFGATIENEARRMLRIVEDLMSLSRIESRRFDPPELTVDLDQVARIAVDQSAHLCAQRQCEIALALEGPVPVRGDMSELVQLADNLIANALRYGCSAAGCAVEVAVRAHKGRGLLLVRDRGEGIAAEHLPRLTERFYRVDAARSRDSGGTGLGLAIAKHIVERHRGLLEFESTPGGGTTVIVALPLAEVAVTKV